MNLVENQSFTHPDLQPSELKPETVIKLKEYLSTDNLDEIRDLLRKNRPRFLFLFFLFLYSKFQILLSNSTYK